MGAGCRDRALSFQGHASAHQAHTRTEQSARGDWRGFTWLMLDLGNVHDVATVNVNSTALACAATKPFRVAITSALKPGPILSKWR